jgi:membrane-bound lytic murein transglycosylase D
MPTRQAAQSVGMDEAALRELNAIPRGMLIRKGSTLLVPRNGHTPAAVDGSLIRNATLSVTPEAVLRRTVVRARKGDTIASLAARYDLPAATVADWNKARTNTRLAAGRRVTVYLPVRARAPARASATRATRPAAKSRRATPARAAAKAPARRAKR